MNVQEKTVSQVYEYGPCFILDCQFRVFYIHGTSNWIIYMLIQSNKSQEASNMKKPSLKKNILGS